MEKFPLLDRYNIDKQKYIDKLDLINKMKRFEPDMNIPVLAKEKFDLLDRLSDEIKQLKLIFYESNFQGSKETILEKNNEIDAVKSELNDIKQKYFTFLKANGFARDYYYDLFDDRCLLYNEHSRKTLYTKMLKCHAKFLNSIKAMELNLEHAYLKDVDRIISGLLEEGYPGLTRVGTPE